MYYREFGIPARIARCYSVADIETQVKKYNGMKNCYASVYVFDDSKDKPDGRANYDSAMIDTIWFDFDHKKGQGLSNEYRLSFASGLTGTREATSYTRVFETP